MGELQKTISYEEVVAAFPSRKNGISEEAVELINRSLTEPEFQGESLLSTAITYENVLKNSKASVTDYIRALKFCAYLVSMEDNYTEAYKRTFSDREFVKARANEGTDSAIYRELTSAASRYRKSKLVADILMLSQVPLRLMFTGARYKAMAVLADEMVTAKFSKDRITAADKLLQHTADPENLKIELDMGVSEGSAVQNLTDQLAIMAAKQKQMIEAGVYTLGDFGAMKVVDEDVLEGVVVNGK